MDLNRIRMKDKNGRQKDYEFSNEDKLFNSYKGSAFPLVAEAIQEDLEAYRKNEEEIRRLKDSMVFLIFKSSKRSILVFPIFLEWPNFKNAQFSESTDR